MNDEYPVPHMSAEEFRRAGHAVVDRIARYMEEVESYPVLSDVAPGELRARLPAAPPTEGEPLVVRDVPLARREVAPHERVQPAERGVRQPLTGRRVARAGGVVRDFGFHF